MSCASYAGNALCIDGVPLGPLAERYGTPLYVYGGAEIRGRYRRFVDAFGTEPPSVHYALKANPTLGIVALLAREGAGADVVSGGELQRALAAGVPAHRIVFAGVGKSGDEIALALDTGIRQLNVEAIEELTTIAAVAAARGVDAPVALRLNPDVAATTHDKISTGRRDDKFGIAAERLDEAMDVIAAHPRLRLTGLHCHIGSQISTLEDFERAYRRMVALWRAAEARGFQPTMLNLGGGLGVRYTDEDDLDVDAFAAMARRVTAGLGCPLAFEPGRYLVAAAGVLLSRVVRVKQASDGRQFVVVDAGMNHLLRPALYGAVHPALPLVRRADATRRAADIVGPICESSDVFQRGAMLPPLEAGDLIAFTNAGAYGSAMASDYNSRGMAGEVLVDFASDHQLKPPRTAEALMADELLPAYLAERPDRPSGNV